MTPFWKKILTECRWWFGVALLLAVPGTLLFLAIDQELWRELQEARSKDRWKLDYVTNSFGLERDGLGMINGYLREMCGYADGAADSLTRFQLSARDLQKRFPGVFEIIVLDRQGKILPGFDRIPELEPTLASFGQDLKEHWSGNFEPLNRHFSRYRAIFGPFIGGSLELGVGTGVYLRSFSPRRGFVFHNGMTKNSVQKIFPLIFITVNDRFWALGHQLQRRNFLQSQPGFTAEIIDLERPLGRWRVPPDTRSYLLRDDLLTRSVEDEQIWFNQGRFWRQISLNTRFRLVYSMPESGWGSYQGRREDLKRTFLLMIAVLFLGFRGLTFQVKEISLRLRILLLFFYTTAIPLVMLGYSAQGLKTDRLENLQRKAYHHAEKVLRELDDTTFEEMTRFERLGRKYSRLALLPGEAGRALVASVGEELVQELKPNYAYISNDEGKQVFQYFPGRLNRSGNDFGSIVKQVSPLFSMQVSRRIADLNHQMLPPMESAREQAISATVESFGLDVGQFVTHMEDNTGRVYSITFGPTQTFGLGFFIHDLNGSARFGTWFVWVEATLYQSFLDCARAFQPRVEDWWVLLSNSAFPPTRPLPDPTAVDQTFTRLIWDPLPLHRRAEDNGVGYLISANWSNRTNRNRMMVIQPETPLVQETSKVSSRLALAAGLLLFSGLLVGFLLSRHLLEPVRELGEGIAAVRRRDFRVRLPVQSPDELGRLGETFNRVVEGLGDLEVAKVIQETLFPDAPLTAADWEISGRCQTASRVGGDYYDYFTLPDGRWLILAGDVSGHGTAAALVVAMAKAVACHSQTPPDPAAILEILNQQLVQTVQFRRLMTCFAVVFDPRSGTLLASNAGHCFPFLIRENTAMEIQVEHPLLGARSRVPFPRFAGEITPGDTVVFYTDGLIETLDAHGEQIGYERFAAALPGMMRDTAENTVSTILDWRAGLAGSANLEDDVTVMVLQNRRTS